jgi:hypothetical protein
VWQATQIVEKVCLPEPATWADAGFDGVMPSAIAAAVDAIAAKTRLTEGEAMASLLFGIRGCWQRIDQHPKLFVATLTEYVNVVTVLAQEAPT